MEGQISHLLIYDHPREGKEKSYSYPHGSRIKEAGARAILSPAMDLLLLWCVVFFVLCAGRQSAICRTQNSSKHLTSNGTHNSISGDQVLLSPTGKFALGFFTPAAINGVNVASTTAVVSNSTTSKRYYLGIWFHSIPQKAVVWVANREHPVVTTTIASNNHSGILRITDDGNIGVFDGEGGELLWSSNITGSTESTTAKLLDNGNLVLTKGANDGIVWRSFDHLTDTMIQGMKLTFNLKTGVGRRLYAWRTPGKDPAPGPVSVGFDPKSSLQMMVWNGTEVLWRTGMWNNKTTNTIRIPNTSSIMAESIVKNDVEVYYTFIATGDLSTLTLTLDVVHGLTDYLFIPKTKNWTAVSRIHSTPCLTYNHCGSFGTCDDSSDPPCKCLSGFKPRNRREWFARNFTNGCVRKVELNGCSGRFVKFTKTKFPDKFKLQTNLSAEQCKAKCWHSCDCIAYAYTNMTQVPVKDLRCFLWYGEELKDLAFQAELGGDVYVRVASSRKSKKLFLIVMVPILLASVLLIIALFYFLWKRRLKIKGRLERSRKANKVIALDGKNAVFDIDGDRKDVGVPPSIDFTCVLAATDEFSLQNKLGDGGFGSVYKGKLLSDQEIAVKRLRKGSSQGFQEFKNEIELIGKLQHTNLVRLLGWCTHDDERILIYEYLPNKSLDKIIFDPSLSATLNWRQRYCIIEGIAQGLLYLHKYSRVRIIHRDLKTSNILLDHAMNPKISDFGLARIFEGNQSEATTKRVVGTYGYMSPEYAMNGLFSEKTDVFSFGVIVLEIITGKRNTGFYPYKESLTLLGYVWQVWKEGRVSVLIDASMGNSSTMAVEDIGRCIQVGLLCVEENIMDRPTMSSIISFLGDENVSRLPTPKKPALAIGRQQDDASPSNVIVSVNDLTITSFGEGR